MYELFTPTQQTFPLLDNKITRNNTNFIVSTSGSNEQLTVPFVSKLYKFTKFIEVVDTQFTELTISPNLLDIQALQNQISTLEQQNQTLSASLSVVQTGLDDANELIDLLANPTVITERWRTDNTFRKMAQDIPNETYFDDTQIEWGSYATAIKFLFGPELSSQDLSDLGAFWAPNIVPNPAFPPGPNNPQGASTYQVQVVLQKLSDPLRVATVSDADILSINYSDIPNNYKQAGPINGIIGFYIDFTFRNLCKALVFNAQQKISQGITLDKFDVLLNSTAINPNDYQVQVNRIAPLPVPPLVTPATPPQSQNYQNGSKINDKLNEAYLKVVDFITGWFKVLNISPNANNVYRFIDELRIYVTLPDAVNFKDDSIRVGKSILWNFYSREIGAVDTDLISNIKLKLDTNAATRYTSFQNSQQIYFDNNTVIDSTGNVVDLSTTNFSNTSGIFLSNAKINAWFRGIDVTPTIDLAQEWKEYIINYYNNSRSEVYTEIEIGSFL